MEQPTADWGAWIRAWWERLRAIDSQDEDEVRLGQLFIELALLLVAVLGFIVLAVWTGYVILPVSKNWPLIVAPVLTLLSGIGIYWVKRGHVRVTLKIYVWVLFGLMSCTHLLFGPGPPTMPFFWWIAIVAGALLGPVYAIVFSVASIVVQETVYFATAAGVYAAPFPISSDPGLQNLVIVLLIFILLGGGLLTYMHSTSLNRALAGQRRLSRELTAARADLETRVQERTQLLVTRAQQFEAIVAVNHVIAGMQDLAELFQTAVDTIAGRFSAYHVGLYLLDDSQDWLRLEAASSAGGKRMIARGHKIAMTHQGIISAVALSAHARIASDVGANATWFANPDLPDTRSQLALPLTARGRGIGVLDIQSAAPLAFTTNDLDVMQILADGLAIAVDNVRLLAMTRKSVARLERFQEEEALHGWRLALSRRNIRLNYFYDRVQVREELPADLEQVMNLTTLSDLQQIVQKDGQYVLLAPIQVQQRTVGVLSFESARPWTAEEEQLARTVIGQLGLALENARLLDTTRLSALQEKARGEILGRVRASVQVDTILRSAAEELGRALQVERARIQLIPLHEQPTEPQA